MFLLAISRILALFVNTLTDDDNYSIHNRENLQKPIQMQLSKKLRFAPYCIISEVYINFATFWKRIEPHSLWFLEIGHIKRRV